MEGKLHFTLEIDYGSDIIYKKGETCFSIGELIAGIANQSNDAIHQFIEKKLKSALKGDGKSPVLSI